MTLRARLRLAIATLVVLPVVSFSTPDGPKPTPIFNYDSLHQPVLGHRGMVVTQNTHATAVGAEILSKGGNAIDAAVAVGFALAVTLPRAGNLGGGGFMLIYLADGQRATAIDYRETAPAAARPELYLDDQGNLVPDRARFTHLAVAVPGSVAGMALAHERYGSFPWRDLVQPAIELADQGFPVTPYLADTLIRLESWLTTNAATAKVFYPNGAPLQVGQILRQPDLAWTLREIRDHGSPAFYEGAVAERLVAEMERGGGVISARDLAQYRAKEREPVTGTYRGYDIVSAPPPSAGGIQIIQILNTLEHFPVADMGWGSAAAIHVAAEAMKRSYADRWRHLGDPDFHPAPITALTSKAYAEQLADSIDVMSVTPAAEIMAGNPLRDESPDTTHYSIADAAGNAVANTYTINYSFGAGLMVEGAGFMLNNEMDDFGIQPGVPNSYGLVPGDNDKLEPGRRPVSSMSPTMVLKDRQPFLIVGTPGGAHIVTANAQIIMNVVDHALNIAEAIHRPRFHHQGFPEVLVVEEGTSPDTMRLLEERGHTVEVSEWASASVQAIMKRDGKFFGGADPRRPDALAIGISAVQQESGLRQ